MDRILGLGSQALGAVSRNQITAEEAYEELRRAGLLDEIKGLQAVDSPNVGNNKKLNKQMLADMELAEVIGPSEDVFRDEVGYDAKGRDEYDPESYTKDYSQKYKRYIALDGKYDRTNPIYVEDDRLRPGEHIGNNVSAAPTPEFNMSAKELINSVRSPGLELVALERERRNSPGEAHRRYRNYMAARKEATEILANSLTGRPSMMDMPTRVNEAYPTSLPVNLGAYLATEPAAPVNVVPKSILEFVKQSTENMEGDSPAVASGDILKELRARALERMAEEERRKMPKAISSREDLMAIEKALRKADKINRVKYKTYNDDGSFKGKIRAEGASFADLMSSLGYKGYERDQLGYALGQMGASSQPARSAKAIDAVPMGPRLGNTDMVAFANDDRIARGIRGVPGSANNYPERGSLRNRLKELDEDLAPGASKQNVGLNREDFDPRREMTGREGMTFNNTGQTTPEGIRQEFERRGYGMRNADLAIRVQQRADEAARKIEEQIELRNRFTPPRMRRII